MQLRQITPVKNMKTDMKFCTNEALTLHSFLQEELLRGQKETRRGTASILLETQQLSRYVTG